MLQHGSESEALPSPNPSDFYKSLLSEGMEGADPELLMDAEEYLQPMGQMKENYTYQPSQGFAFPPVSWVCHVTFMLSTGYYWVMLDHGNTTGISTDNSVMSGVVIIPRSHNFVGVLQLKLVH